MPKKARALTAREIASRKGANAVPGLYAVGGVSGLYLQVAPGQGRSWVLRYQYAGKRRDMGLGSLDDFGLAKARERAVELRQKIAQGIDPIAERKAAKAASRTAAAKAMTFA